MEERKLPAWAPTVAVAVALTALVIGSFLQRWEMLGQSPFPVGIDGYFYPIQLRSLLEDGHLAYPASPLAFYLLAPFAAATDPVTGAKLGTAVWTALIVLPAYGVGARLGKSRGAGLLAAALVATSAGSQFLTFEFVKNGIGLTIGLCALWLVLRALERPTRGRIAAALLAVLAAFLTHKMAAAIVVIVAVPAAIAEAAARGALRGRRLIYAIAAVIVLAVIAIALGAAFPERFLSVADLSHGSGLWGPAHWDAPALITPRSTLAMGHEAAIGGVLAIVAALSLLKTVRGPLVAELGTHSRGETIAAWVVIGLALVIALPWLNVVDPQGIGFRIRIAAFLPMALCAAIAARLVVAPIAKLIAARWSSAIREGVLALVALVIVLAMPRYRVEGRIVAHAAMVAAVQALAGRIPEGDVAIVPERHIAYMVVWYARVPMRLRPDSVPRERRWRVMPLAFIRAGSPLDQALLAARNQPTLTPPLGTHPRHPNGLVLVAEPTWEWVLAQLPADVLAYYQRWPTI
ncbi:MAG: hypothetical protein JWP01_3473 [Myxococcales bacterium]|nr:hypothetical protein [Myxococcales bacterium]